jgi:hypothetical protein
MINDQDHYEAYYAGKLWNLLPAVYRAQDTNQLNSNGPLRELVNRIGGQAAILRRSIDRMWEDQSIETCDDWVIPYIGDLLATNLVANLDAAGQRLDVARTISYRRRKGTVAVLEEIAANITGWDAMVVEFFRRLGRTRHGLDPAIGPPSSSDSTIGQLQAAEGLVGALSRTAIGGMADLRNAYGASKAGSPFDEFFHTADFRRGQGQVGWYGIPRLGIFLWRLESFATGVTTPVPIASCPGWFTFDPTGRSIPLFAAGRTASDYGESWVSPSEAQLPTPITQPLFDAQFPPTPGQSQNGTIAPPFPLYPSSLGVFQTPDPTLDSDAISPESLRVQPPEGRFHVPSSASTPVWVKYHFGFSSTIGAGPYDRRPGRTPPPTPAPASSLSGGGNAPLSGARAIPSFGTLTLADSLTYTAMEDNVAVNGPLTIQAGEQERPLIRLATTKDNWTEIRFNGSGASSLVLDGLFFSGLDLVLAGNFDSVTLTCCTLDPGSVPPPGPLVGSSPPADFAVAADGQELVPCRLWIEGTVGTLTIERSITGPIRTRSTGEVETLSITESIIQAIPTPSLGSIVTRTPFSAPPGKLIHPLVADAVSPDLPDPALAISNGDVSLSRCTVMGPVVVHRLEASECILQDVVQVDDIQDGCVRFTAFADGSIVPRQYESVRINPQAPLFTSTDFGQPGYGQLLATVDTFILPAPIPDGAAPPTIAAGAQDGSEMGAFAREKNAVKERGLLLKLQEFMPAGLVPVLVYIT